MTYSYTFEIGEAEQVRACRIVINRRWSMRLMYAFFILCLLVVAGLYAVDVGHGKRGWDFGLFVVTVALVVGLSVGYMAPRSTVKSLRKKNRAATGPQTYTLSDGGLQATGTGASTSLEWGNIVEALETREFLLFYVSAAWAVLLPKRIVPATELEELRRALLRWLPEKARLHSR